MDDKLYKFIFDFCADGILIADVKSMKFVAANPMICKMLGYNKKEFLNMSVMTIHPQADLKHVISKFEAQAKDKKSLAENIPCLKKNKTIFYADINTSPILLEGKKYNVGFFRDISERKIAEKNRIESEKKFKILFETSRDAIMTLAPPAWLFTSANPATVKMFNTKNEKEFISLGPWQVSPEFQPDGQKSDNKAKKMITTAMKKGTVFFEWTHKKVNGKNFPATVLLTAIIVNGKKQLQATVRDITEQKKYQLELEEKIKELEKFQKSIINRELKMIELKKKIKVLKSKFQPKARLAKRADNNNLT